MRIQPTLALFAVVGLLFTFSGTAQEMTLATAGQEEAVLIVAPGNPGRGIQRAVETWRQFLQERGFQVETASNASPGDGGLVIAFEVVESPVVASQAEADVAALRGARPESHLLQAQDWQGRPLVLVVGAADQGVDAGAAQLLSKIGYQDGALSIQPIREVRTPFIKGREATLTPTGRILESRPEVMKKANYEHWNEEQLRDLTKYVKACGFNSLQIMELLAYRQGTQREKVAPVLHTLAKAAHDNGLRVSQYIWGSRDTFRWDDPNTRPQREERYRELAKTYGPHVDHIITHWIDEGYEGGYVIPQEATVFLWNEYRKHNPDVQATFDTWGNDERSNAVEPGEGFWDKSGEPGFLDETYSPKEVGVALERWYDPEKSALVKKAGRRLGIWGWYLADYEMEFASHLEARVLEKYFSSLPEKASEEIDWLSIERCFHALPADVNWYVTGQLMWTPDRPAADILLDFCRAVYGPAHAEAMREVYQVVEEGQKDYKYYGYFIPESDRFPDVHATPEYQQRAKEALEKLDAVKLPEGWKPNFPTPAPPQDYIAGLRASLEALSQGQYPEF